MFKGRVTNQDTLEPYWWSHSTENYAFVGRDTLLCLQLPELSHSSSTANMQGVFAETDIAEHSVLAHTPHQNLLQSCSSEMYLKLEQFIQISSSSDETRI